MQIQIQLRRDTAANWVSNNPVLASGEPGVETDTGKIKIGDGSTAWNSLAYAVEGNANAVTAYQSAVSVGQANAATAYSSAISTTMAQSNTNAASSYASSVTAGQSNAATAFQSAIAYANSTIWVTANAAYVTANAGYTATNAAYTTANAGFDRTNSSYTTANAGFDRTNSSYTTANAGYGTANSGYGTANAGYGTANAAYGKANSANIVGANASITYVIDGGGSVITTGNKGYLEIPFPCGIQNVSVLLDNTTGTLNVEVWKSATYPPTSSQAIYSGFVCSATNYARVANSTIAGAAGGVPTMAANEFLAFNVAASPTPAYATRATISIKVVKL